jgi:hypothetical protein
MHSVKAQVRNGRLVVDEPTDLPEGKVIELIPIGDTLAPGGDELDGDERAALHRSIEEGFEDFDKGDVEDAFEFLRRLKSEREDRDRPASADPGPARK